MAGLTSLYFQSQRLDRYRAFAERLVKEGRAYYCYCTPDAIRQKRETAEAAGGGWAYDRTCCALSPQDIAQREAAGVPRAIRFKVPAGQTTFADLVHGPIAFENAVIEDFVVLRSDAQPTYHLSVVVDDIDMQITHVVRGDDHISNTPKQVLLYRAFSSPTPSFAHVPLILGPDKKRLSKRHGATSVMEYPHLGYLPEAMVNFLSLLGWSPGGDQELFTRDELVQRFTLEGISGGNAVFNPEKLDWFNQQHMARLTLDNLASRVEPRLREAGLWSDDFSGSRRAWFHQVLELLKPRVKRLGQFVDDGRPFFTDTVECEPDAVQKHLKANVKAAFDEWTALLAKTEPFEPAALESTMRAFAESKGVKFGALVHATRVAVTGRANSPGLFDVIYLVGRERSVARMTSALARFS